MRIITMIPFIVIATAELSTAFWGYTGAKLIGFLLKAYVQGMKQGRAIP